MSAPSESSESSSEDISQDPTQGTTEAEKRRFSGFTRRLFVILMVLALAIVLWQVTEVLLLVFLGVLIAIFIDAGADILSRQLSVSRSAGLGIFGILLLVLVGLGGWYFGVQIADQSDQIAEQFKKAVESIQQHPWGQRIVQQVPNFQEALSESSGIFSQGTGAASRIFDILATALIVLFLAIYLAVDPGIHTRGIVLLFPEEQRPNVREALEVTGRALWFWLRAQFVSMAIVGVLTWVGLLLLGIPLASLLGLLTGLLEFVPIVGAIVSAVPAILMAFVEGPMYALYVAILYMAIQGLEGNLITPLVQEQGVSLPPSFTLLAAVIFGILFGPLGIIVATPLMVVVFVLVKLLYVERVLGSATLIPGRE